IHLRDRLAVLTGVLRPEAVDGVPIAVVVVAPPNDRAGLAGVRDVLAREYPHVRVVGQIANDPKGAAYFNGSPGRRAARTLLIRSARDLTTSLAGYVEPFFVPGGGLAAATQRAPMLDPSPMALPEPAPSLAQTRASASPLSAPQIAGPPLSGPQFAGSQMTGTQIAGPQIAGPRMAGPQIAAPQFAGTAHPEPEHSALTQADAQPSVPALFEPRHSETPLPGSRSPTAPALTPTSYTPPIAPPAIAPPPPPPGENWFAVEGGPSPASGPTWGGPIWDGASWNGSAWAGPADDEQFAEDRPDAGSAR
ncbi:MAG: hypothetical protein ACQSGP_24530, partial [Frankia sp.]